MRVPALLIAVVLALVTSGCTGFADEGGGRASDARPGVVATAAPDSPVTVLADEEPVAAAAGMSRALFDRSPIVVVARDGDHAGTLLAASAAVGLGVPLLLEPAGGGAADDLAGERARLGAETVLAVGAADGTAVSRATDEESGGARHEVVAVPADAGALAAVTGVRFAASDPVGAADAAAAVAALEPGRPLALRADDAPAPPEGAEPTGTLPAVERGEPLNGTVVLATGAPESVAALATARAAAARVQLTGGGTDPRSSGEVIDALSDEGTTTVVALGADLAAEDGLQWKLATAATGVQLPGGGQLVFPGRLLVALYGHPGSGALGVLGEQSPEASVQRARDHAAPYDGLVDVPVVPAFEIIATVASSAAGDDGNYSAEADVEVLRPWVEAAGEAGLYVLLDLQPGRTDFVTQAERYRSLLELPHVGLALDPEWRLGPDEMHLTQIGSVGVEEVNSVVAWLADLTQTNALPQKLLVLHQFQLRMIPGRERLDTSRDELAVVVHADGQGAQGDKQATWQALHENEPAGIWWGWKNFYDEDAPMLTPQQTVAQVRPTPALISYQ